MPLLSTVQDIMTPNVVTVSPATVLLTAIETMRERHYSCMVVAEDDGKPLGMITERDVLRLTNILLRGTAPGGLKAKSIMTHPPITIRQQATVVEALAICKDKKIRHLPVVNQDGKLVGLLTQSDLVNCFMGMIAEQGKAAKRAVATNGSLADLDHLEEDLKSIVSSVPIKLTAMERQPRPH